MQSLETLRDHTFEQVQDTPDKALLFFGKIMRKQEEETLNDWGDRLLTHLVPFIKALQGALYYIEVDGSELSLIGEYASLKTFSQKKIPLGEGTIGQVAVSNKKIHIQNIKGQNFLAYTGSVSLKVCDILVLPIAYNHILYGVLELSYITPPSSEQISFLEILAENIGTILNILLKEQALKKQNDNLSEAIQMLHNTQAQLVQAEKMSSLGVLTAGIAHEINNPINYVSVGAELLPELLEDLLHVCEHYEKIITTDSPVKRNEYLQQLKEYKEHILFDKTLHDIKNISNDIQSGANRIKEIVSSLRNFSRVDKNKLVMTDIHDGINSTLIILGSQLKTGINIVKYYSPTLPQIPCSPGKINQVFMNILANAIQAIQPDEGTITIATRLHEEKDQISVTIQDTGGGIPEDIQDKIFEPFYTTKDVGKGTGLGLSISYSIVQDHNGEIEVKSKKGVGTQFVIYLPLNHK